MGHAEKNKKQQAHGHKPPADPLQSPPLPAQEDLPMNLGRFPPAPKDGRSREELLEALLEQADLLERKKIGTFQALFDVVRSIRALDEKAAEPNPLE